MKTSDFHMVMDQAQQVAKPVGDVTALTIAGGAVVGWLPPIAAAMSIIWIGIQIFDYFEKRNKDK